MSVAIRLRRIGKNPKKKPHFRVSVFNNKTGRDGRIIEELGFYSPITGQSKIDKVRLEEWVKKGAQLSATVKSLIKKTKK